MVFNMIIFGKPIHRRDTKSVAIIGLIRSFYCININNNNIGGINDNNKM